jgi:hypothetical protein
MTARPSRGPRPVVGTVLLAVALVALAGCAQGPSAAPTATSPGASTTPPGGASAGPGASLPAQADTAWGRIWEGLPNSFPQAAGAEPTEVGGAEPASATLDVPTTAGTVDAVVSFYRTALEAAGYSVSVDGPLENGGFTVAATGSSGCAAQVSVEPMGSSMTVTVLYGAACPFD